MRTLRFRIKDRHRDWLRSLAREVNLVWNYCNELSLKVFERERRFMSGFELQKYLNGASKEGLVIGSPVFQQVAEEYATRRRQHKKVRLAWRKSGGARRSLGWIPFKARAVEYRAGQIRFNGAFLSLWDSYGLSDYLAQGARLRAGSFSEDARGRWYLNVAVEMPGADEFVGPQLWLVVCQWLALLAVLATALSQKHERELAVVFQDVASVRAFWAFRLFGGLPDVSGIRLLLTSASLRTGAFSWAGAGHFRADSGGTRG